MALTLTAQKMLTFGVLVNNLDIIETLGAVTCICSDKTGTLTQNRMSVSHLVYDKRISIIPHVTPVMKEDNFLPFDPADPHFKALINLGIINTEAVFMTHEPDVMKRQVKGDASEAGLIKVLSMYIVYWLAFICSFSSRCSPSRTSARNRQWCTKCPSTVPTNGWPQSSSRKAALS